MMLVLSWERAMRAIPEILAGGVTPSFRGLSDVRMNDVSSEEVAVRYPETLVGRRAPEIAIESSPQ